MADSLQDLFQSAPRLPLPEKLWDGIAADIQGGKAGNSARVPVTMPDTLPSFVAGAPPISRKRSFFMEHALSLAAAAILMAFPVIYITYPSDLGGLAAASLSEAGEVDRPSMAAAMAPQNPDQNALIDEETLTWLAALGQANGFGEDDFQ